MKRTRIITAIAALCCAATISASEPTFENPTKKISNQLQKMLSKNNIDVTESDVSARVLFKVDESGEIKLLRVSSERKDLKGLIDKKLEGKKLSVDPTSIDEVYVVEVRVTL